MVVLCAQVVLLAQRMCPHASGVMLLGARGFFTHFISPCVQYRTILGPQWCQVLLYCVLLGARGYAVRRPGFFYGFQLTFSRILSESG